MTQAEPHKIALNIMEAAYQLGIGRNKTLELVHSGRLKSVRVGRRIVIPHRELEAFLARETEAQK